MDNLGLKTPILEKLLSKIEILSTPNLLCRKFVTFCLACFLPTTPLLSDTLFTRSSKHRTNIKQIWSMHKA